MSSLAGISLRNKQKRHRAQHRRRQLLPSFISVADSKIEKFNKHKKFLAQILLNLPGKTASIVVVIVLFIFSISHRPQLKCTVN